MYTLIRQRRIHEYNTWHRNDYRLDGHRLCLYEKLPSQAGIKLFNSLPEHIKVVRGTKQFKSKLKQCLIMNSFYSLGEFMDQDNQIAPY